ncbi:MAG: hypothetical protein SFU86_10365 [Pirellulaceae bacterium]|nr:hypothetical protein [Pirellulaceae bacterium]
MAQEEFDVKYLGGDPRIPAVSSIERFFGGRNAFVRVDNSGVLTLVVNNSYGTASDSIKYSRAEILHVFLASNGWQMIGLQVGRPQYVLKVKAGISGGSYEVFFTFEDYFTLGGFNVAMEEAGLPRT